MKNSATQGASASQLSPGWRNLPTRADRGLGSSALLLPLARCVVPGPSFSFLALASAWLFFASRLTYNATQFPCGTMVVGHE